MASVMVGENFVILKFHGKLSKGPTLFLVERLCECMFPIFPLFLGSNSHNNGNPGGDGQTGDAGQGTGGLYIHLKCIYLGFSTRFFILNLSIFWVILLVKL